MVYMQQKCNRNKSFCHVRSCVISRRSNCTSPSVVNKCCIVCTFSRSQFQALVLFLSPQGQLMSFFLLYEHCAFTSRNVFCLPRNNQLLQNVSQWRNSRAQWSSHRTGVNMGSVRNTNCHKPPLSFGIVSYSIQIGSDQNLPISLHEEFWIWFGLCSDYYCPCKRWLTSKMWPELQCSSMCY